MGATWLSTRQVKGAGETVGTSLSYGLQGKEQKRQVSRLV